MTAPASGAQTGGARGSITIDTSDLVRAQRAALDAARQINQALSTINQGTTQAQAGISELVASFRQLGPALGIGLGGLGAAQLVRTTVNLAEMAAQANRTRFAFENLSGGARQAAANLEAIRGAARNTVGEFEAMGIANQAMSLKLARTTEEFTSLVRAARAVSMVSPSIRDISGAMSEIGLASANLSFKRLDQLALTTTEVKDRMEELRKTMRGADDSALFWRRLCSA